MKMRIKREDLESEIRTLRLSEHRLLVAMNDTLEGKVQWFRRGVYKVGVTRIESPEGPTVIVRFAPGGQSPYASAHSWDDVWRFARDMAPCDKEQIDYRDLMLEVQAHINRELAKLTPIAA